jgi:hypothetical protein
MKEITLNTTVLKKPIIIYEDTIIKLNRFSTLSFEKYSTKSKKYGHFKFLNNCDLIITGENKNESSIDLWLFERPGFFMCDNKSFKTNIEFKNLTLLCGPLIKWALKNCK